MMKRFGFFGGSFNPPTNAHISIAKEAISELNLDSFFFVPVGNLYSKPDLTDEKYRYDMLKIACKNEKDIYVEDIELNQLKPLSAIDAFNMIENKYNKNNDTEIFFVMGADNFMKLPTWNNAKKMIEKYQYIIFERNNLDIKSYIEANELLKENRKNFNILKLDNNEEVSSGIIRDLIKMEKYEECKQFTKTEIIEYIKANKLY